MGGDNAPAAIVQGALDAHQVHGIDVILVGRTEEILRALESCGETSLPAGIEIKDASEVIEISDDPAMAFKRKPNSSLTVGLELLRDNMGDAFISAGSTGALLAGATLVVKRIKGIRRAAMSPSVPAKNGSVLLCDCGANAECTPEYLLQFAYLSSFYAQKVYQVHNPRVGLLNIGAEPEKGDALRRETFALLSKAQESGRLNFIGNIEASAALMGGVDVMITDGFSGNIMLKTLEGTALFLLGEVKKLLLSNTKAKLAAGMLKSEISVLKNRVDASEIGATPLLGISKPVLKAHGSSNARAICNAILRAKEYAESGFIDQIRENIDAMKI